MEVVDNGKIELFDSEGMCWMEYDHVSGALAAAGEILRRQVEQHNREQAAELVDYRDDE
jgi:hypothetical protein